MKSDTVGRPMEILLVEDSLPSARLTMGVLRNANFQHRMTWLSNGVEASDFLQKNGKYKNAPKPDLILLDLGLPKKDGRQLLKELRADDSTSSIAVVVLTASTDESDMANSEQLQVESYMTKPVDLEKFMVVVKDLNRFWHADMILPGSGRTGRESSEGAASAGG